MMSEKRFAVALLVVVFVALSYASETAQPATQGEYVESRQCENSSVCTYRFTASHQFFQGDLLQNFTLSAVVRVGCLSVGTFNRTQAIEYCLTVNNVLLLDSPFGKNDINSQEQRTLMTKLFSGQFCFVQVENGHVVEISYEQNSHPEGVNLKKSIAAAFQANFQNQEEEEEEDPQSLHVAHYRYEPTESASSIKMHRSVFSSDVREYSTGVRVKDVQLEKEADIEYRSGHLYHSSGSMTVKLVKPRQRLSGRHTIPSLQDGPLNEEMISANGTYELDLLDCYSVLSPAKRRRRSDRKPMIRGSLKIVVNKGSLARSEMEDLRKSMPSISDVLMTLQTNPENNKLSDQLERLLILESEFGALSGFTPAVDVVIEFLNTLNDAVQPIDSPLKSLLYSMLSTEGSYKSQKVIIGALQSTSTNSERTSIITVITFIHHANPGLLSELEHAIISTENHLDPLLLAYGALASETTVESEQRIVTFLLNRMEESPKSTITTIHYIHALGNTGSLFALNTIISFHNHTDIEVQLATITAIRKLVNNPLVEKIVYSMLQTKPASYEHVVAIAETLSEGAKYLDDRDVDYTPSIEIQTALVTSAVQLGDIELAELVLSFVETFETPVTEGLVEALEHVKSLNRRRRGTDWDEANSDYDIVASQGSRATDVQNYPSHIAYIWGKTIGISQANIKLGAGLFLGHHPTCPNLKAFGKAVAQANLLRWSWNVLHAEALLEKTNTQVRARMYFKVLSNVLTDLSATRDWSGTNCATTPPRTVYSSPRYSLPRLSYSVFIYVGTLTLYLQPHAQCHIDFQTELCAVSSSFRAFAGITPRLTFTVEGSAQGSLADLVRGGVSVNVSFDYRIEGSGEGRLCFSCVAGSPQTQACVNASEGWPNNRINFYTWYQLRTITLSWGRVRRWDDFSRTWNLPSRQLQPIYNTCGVMRDPTCPLSTPPPTTLPQSTSSKIPTTTKSFVGGTAGASTPLSVLLILAMGFGILFL